MQSLTQPATMNISGGADVTPESLQLERTRTKSKLLESPTLLVRANALAGKFYFVSRILMYGYSLVHLCGFICIQSTNRLSTRRKKTRQNYFKNYKDILDKNYFVP